MSSHLIKELSSLSSDSIGGISPQEHFFNQIIDAGVAVLQKQFPWLDYRHGFVLLCQGWERTFPMAVEATLSDGEGLVPGFTGRVESVLETISDKG